MLNNTQLSIVKPYKLTVSVALFKRKLCQYAWPQKTAFDKQVYDSFKIDAQVDNFEQNL